MAEIDRRRRLAGRMKALLPVAIQEKQTKEAISICRLIMALEQWDLKGTHEVEPAPAPAPDMGPLLAHITEEPK
jgi:hypothetical protein